ncbi:MAG: hypothetical protein R3F14_43850 [Polyangiaceae bacterium]
MSSSLPSRSRSLLRACSLAAVASALALTFAPQAPAQTKPATAPKASSKPAAKPAPSASSTGAAPPELPQGSDELQRAYLEGDAALKQGAFGEAETHFTKAWVLSKSFDVAAALGSTKLELGKYREAAQYLSYALRNALPSTRPTTRDRIKRDLDIAREHLATIKVTLSLTEATFAVDGAVVDPMFLGPEIYVDPGQRTFEATADTYAPAKRVLDVKAAQLYVVALTLERPTTPKSAPTAAPTAQSTPWPAAVLGATGAAAIVAGAVLVGAAETKKTEAYDLARNTLTPEGNPTCPTKGPGPTERCDQVRAAAADADLFGNTGIGVFIGAGALLAGATVYMLFIRPDPGPDSPPPDPLAASRLIPFAGPTGGGFVWQGSF